MPRWLRAPDQPAAGEATGEVWRGRAPPRTKARAGSVPSASGGRGASSPSGAQRRAKWAKQQHNS